MIRFIKTIPMSEAKRALDGDASICLIDVRTPEEYQKGHIPGSINIPLEDIEDIAVLIGKKTTKIFLYCKSGKRSARACYALQKMGYTDATNIGGINDWIGPVVKERFP